MSEQLVNVRLHQSWHSSEMILHAMVQNYEQQPNYPSFKINGVVIMTTDNVQEVSKGRAPDSASL